MGARFTGGFRRRGNVAAAVFAITVLGATFASVSTPASAAVTPAAGTTIVAAHSGMCANVKGGVVTDKAEVVQYNCAPQFVNDKWKVVPNGDGTYHIIAAFSGKCLNVPQSATANLVKIIQYTCSPAGKNDRWRFRPVAGKPTFQVVAEHSGKCLNVPRSETTLGIAIIQYTCGAVPGPNEQWYFPPATSPTPAAPPVAPNSPVVAVQGSPSNGAAVGPLTYAFVDNLGRLLVGHQANPDVVDTVQWSTISGLEGFTGQPAVAVQADGRVQVVAHNSTDSDVWLATQTAKGEPAFGTWQDVGGAQPYRPTVARKPDGKLVVFSLGAGGGLWHLPQDGTNTPFGAWRYIGGKDFVGTPTVVATRDGLRLFALDTKGVLQSADYRAGVLSDWTSLGGVGLTGTVSAVVYPGYRIRIFARTADGAVVTKIAGSNGSFPEPWTVVGSSTVAGSPSAVLDPIAGVAAVVARGEDGRIYYSRETGQDSGTWGEWKSSSDYVSATDPTAIAYNRGSGVSGWGYLVRDADGKVSLFRQDGIGSASARATRAASTFSRHVLPAPPK